MPPDDRAAFTRNARRWADAAWERGWHAHALDVLDHAIRFDADDFKLFRKRGAFNLLCPDSTVRDEEQGFSDLRRACELSGWRDELVRWAAEMLADIGDKQRANELLRERQRRSGEAAEGEGD